MRVAVIVVTMLVVTTPLEASHSCMSKTEARRHFGSAHIYWHGPDHCWDATPTRRDHQIHNVVQRKIDQPKWPDSMSKMLPDEDPVQTSAQTSVQMQWVDRWVNIEPSQLPLVARRVDIVQVAPPPVIAREPEPMASLRAVVLVFIAIVLTFTIATIEVLFRGTIYERPKSTTNL
jgi:hypothetical protein